MNTKSSRKELAEAGRRKLEAFKRQKKEQQEDKEQKVGISVPSIKEVLSDSQASRVTQQPRVGPSPQVGNLERQSKPFSSTTLAGPGLEEPSQRENLGLPASDQQARPNLANGDSTADIPIQGAVLRGRADAHANAAGPKKPRFPQPPPLLNPKTVKEQELDARNESASMLPESHQVFENGFSSAEEELPISSPSANGYAALSDSYLSHPPMGTSKNTAMTADSSSSAVFKAGAREGAAVRAPAMPATFDTNLGPQGFSRTFRRPSLSLSEPSPSDSTMGQSTASEGSPVMLEIPSAHRQSGQTTTQTQEKNREEVGEHISTRPDADIDIKLAPEQTEDSGKSSTLNQPWDYRGVPSSDTGRGSANILQSKTEGVPSGLDSSRRERPRHERVASLKAWSDSLLPTEQPESSGSPPDSQSALSNARLTSGQDTRVAAESFRFSKLPDPADNTKVIWESSESPETKNRQDSAAPDDSGDERVKTAGAASLADFGTEDMKSGVESSVSQIGETKGLELQNLSQSSHVDEDKAFGMLHTHIDELTREKFELARGLTKQQEMSASLAQENQRLLDDYNDQGQHIQQLKFRIQELETELDAQHLALASLAAEKEAGHSLLQEALQRAEDLAGEVILLEEQRLHARSAELRAGKRAEEVALEAHRARQQQATTAADCASLRSTVQTLQEQQKILIARLRSGQAELNSGQPLLNGARNLEAAQESVSVQPQPALSADHPNSTLSPQKETQMSRITNCSLKEVKGLQAAAPASDSDIARLLAVLLPPRSYQGDLSREAEEIAAEERRVMTSIDSLLDGLEKEKDALLVTLSAHQIQCSHLQSRNSELAAQLEEAKGTGLYNSAVLSHTAIPQPIKDPNGRTSTLSWLASIIAPRPRQ